MFKLLADFIISEYEFLGLDNFTALIFLTVLTVLIEGYVLYEMVSPTVWGSLIASLAMNAVSAYTGLLVRAIFGFNSAGLYAHYILGEPSYHWYGDAFPPGYIRFILAASFLISLLIEGILILLWWENQPFINFPIRKALKGLMVANLASYALWGLAVLLAA